MHKFYWAVFCLLLVAILNTGKLSANAQCVITETDTIVDGGAITTELNGTRFVFILEDKAYVTGRVDDSLAIFDISDPTMLSQLGSICDNSMAMGACANNTATLLDGPIDVFVAGDKAYVTSNINDSLSIFDISDPTMITELGVISDDTAPIPGTATELNGAFGVFVKGRFAYVASSDDDSLSIFDITDPTMIREVSTIVDGAGATRLNNPKEVFVQGKYAYVASQTDDSLSIFDISDPSRIFELSTIFDDSMVGGLAKELDGASSVFVAGDTAYVTSRNDESLSTFDVSNKTRIAVLGNIKKGVGATQLDEANSVFVRGNNAYVVSETDDSLSIFDVTDPRLITEVGVITDDTAPTPGVATELDGAFGVFVDGNFAYVASLNDDSLSIFDINTPACLIPGVELSGNTNLELPNDLQKLSFPFTIEAFGLDKSIKCKLKTKGDVRMKISPRKIELKPNGFNLTPTVSEQSVNLTLSKKKIKAIRGDNKDRTLNLSVKCKGNKTKDSKVETYTDSLQVTISPREN